MQREYLLDTNAFFNLLKAMNPDSGGQSTLSESVKNIMSERLFVSSITKVEIISVLGKYARGNTGGFQKCNCQISPNGDLCQNSRYSKPRKKWSKRKVKLWKQFIDEILEGKSRLISIGIKPFDLDTVLEAQKIIEYALVHNFASMDAMIAATAKIAKDDQHDITVITSDKGLKACLGACSIPCYDLFTQ